MVKIWIKDARIFDGDNWFYGHVQLDGEWICRIEKGDIFPDPSAQVIEAKGKWLIPGLIDDQVHFREPGLTHKACIETESRAAVLGGITSYMEMPNTVPPAFTIDRLEEKFNIAEDASHANYSFYLGASEHHLDEIKKINPAQHCGLKIFMGSSTGDLLVEDEEILRKIFAASPVIIATHCEDDQRIKQNLLDYQEKYPDGIPPKMHPIIRDRAACFMSTEKAIRIAKDTGARLHVLHISTAEETLLFEAKPTSQKRITAEACVHHLWFSDADYPSLGNLIKCNPAIKTSEDRDAIRKAISENRIDVIATDHAPHTWEEKNQPYEKAPSGLPLVQHSLLMLLEMARNGDLNLEMALNKSTARVAELFGVADRGFIRENYKADLVLIDPTAECQVKKNQLAYRCGWSPLEGFIFHHQIEKVWVNGILKVNEGQIASNVMGQRLAFNR